MNDIQGYYKMLDLYIVQNCFSVNIMNALPKERTKTITQTDKKSVFDREILIFSFQPGIMWILLKRFKSVLDIFQYTQYYSVMLHIDTLSA